MHHLSKTLILPSLLINPMASLGTLEHSVAFFYILAGLPSNFLIFVYLFLFALTCAPTLLWVLLLAVQKLTFLSLRLHPASRSHASEQTDMPPNKGCRLPRIFGVISSVLLPWVPPSGAVTSAPHVKPPAAVRLRLDRRQRVSLGIESRIYPQRCEKWQVIIIS